jgi:hypothetical protein
MVVKQSDALSAAQQLKALMDQATGARGSKPLFKGFRIVPEITSRLEESMILYNEGKFGPAMTAFQKLWQALQSRLQYYFRHSAEVYFRPAFNALVQEKFDQDILDCVRRRLEDLEAKVETFQTTSFEEASALYWVVEEKLVYARQEMGQRIANRQRLQQERAAQEEANRLEAERLAQEAAQRLEQEQREQQLARQRAADERQRVQRAAEMEDLFGSLNARPAVA